MNNDGYLQHGIAVADRLPEQELELMVQTDYLVRAYIAKHLPEGPLFR